MRHITLTVALIVVGVGALYAQDTGEDYLQYKFYKEDNDEDNTLWLRAVEREESYNVAPTEGLPQRAEYMLSAMGFMARGVDYDERSNLVGKVNIGYSTARMLSALGIGYSDYAGVAGAVLSGTLGRTRSFLEDRDAHIYAGHNMRLDISGRNYLGGISHRGRYKPATDGVVLKDGWSFAHYARGRTGRDLFVDGVFTNGVDIAAEATYRSRRDWLNVTLMLPWSERGLRSSSIEEAYTLTDNKFYNPSWGMQDGKMRNSRVATMLHPEVVALWQRRLSAITELRVSADVGFERGGYTTLAWFNAPSPAPDNYHYMPSFHTDDATSREVRNAWLANNLKYTQIDWDGLHHTNALQHDGSARYAVVCRRENRAHNSLAAMLTTRFGEFDVEYGAHLEYNTTREFKVMDDLLGARYIIDVDYNLIDDDTYANNLQNNLREPNRTILEGDRFGYDFRLSRLGITLHGALHREWKSMSLHAALDVGTQSTTRHGYYEKELFPDDGSYGRSRRLMTNPYRVSLLWSYNVDEHLFTASALLRGKSPEVDDMFLQREYNNRATENYTLATTFATDLSYGYTSQRVSIAATLYMLATANESDVIHCYDDLSATFSDAHIRGISRLNIGLEASATVRWSGYLSSTFMLSAARYRYLRDAEVRLYADADNDLISISRAAVRGCHTGAPEVAAYGDVTLRHSGWTARMALGYVGSRYVEPSFVRRTERLLGLAPSSKEREVLTAETRLQDALSLDASVAKRVRLCEGVSLNVELSVRNVLGNSFVEDGYEQNRVRRTTITGRTYLSPFADRLRYAYPRTFYLTASLWF